MNARDAQHLRPGVRILTQCKTDFQFTRTATPGREVDGELGGSDVDIQRFNLHGSGLTRVLGELAGPIMDALWRCEAMTVKELCQVLGPEVHYKTVLTVANRLVDKGLLMREPSPSRSFIYRPTVSRTVFLDQVMTSVASGLVEDFGCQALAHFVQVADDLDPSYLDELEELVRARKRGRG